jgi:hypothetical protein
MAADSLFVIIGRSTKKQFNLFRPNTVAVAMGLLALPCDAGDIRARLYL